jgi:hypothetical protein
VFGIHGAIATVRGQGTVGVAAPVFSGVGFGAEVAFLAVVDSVVPAGVCHTGATGDGAEVALFDAAAVGAAAVVVGGVVVVAELAFFEQAVATDVELHTKAAWLWTNEAIFDSSAVGAAAIVVHLVAVITSFGRFDGAVAAVVDGDAVLAWNGALEALLDAAAVCTTAITVSGVAVITGFVGVEHAVATDARLELVALFGIGLGLLGLVGIVVDFRGGIELRDGTRGITAGPGGGG